MKTQLVKVPKPQDLTNIERAAALEMEVRSTVREVRELEDLAPSQEAISRLAVALAGTKPGHYIRAAARRVEWQIGQVLGPPPGSGRHKSLANDFLSDNEVRDFRLLGTLNLDWDNVGAWDESRARLVKTALERRRNGSDGGELDIRRGRFQEVLADIEPGSVSLVLTDPPYADKNLHLYVDLAEFGADKLCDGGSLICYTGHTILPEAIPAMSEYLRYWWLMALEHRAGGRQLPGKWVWVGWKPVMWFVKEKRRDRVFIRDVIRGKKPDKALHDWAQGVDEVMPLIERLTNPDELVCDPFAGSGSFGIAAQRLGRRFIGADDG